MNFYLPTKLICGENAVVNNAEKIAEFGKSCLIVTGGSSAKRCGALDDVLKALQMHDISYCIYDSVKPNPGINSVLEGGKLAAEKGCDFVIGIGGGSPLDAAKVIAVSAANPTLDKEELYSMNWPNDPLPIVLVGTTAGTGSEVTPVSVITDTNGRKRSFRGDKIYADLSFGDPRYTASMPLSLTASTAVDAFAHCMESYFSKKATAVSRAYAAEGLRMLIEPLRHIANGIIPDIKEREVLYDASILGGMAISVTGTNLGHNLGYYLTESHDIPHGFACAVYQPAIIRHAEKAVPQYCNELFRMLDISTDDMIALLKKLTPSLGVELSCEEIEALLPRWENAPNIKNTIGELSIEDIRHILCDVLVKEQ